MMERNETIKAISENLEEIREKYHVDSIALFGSIARDDANPDSDVDVLVSFRTVPSLFGFLDLKEYLENKLARPVDLVTEKALKKQLRDQILTEAVIVS